MKINEIKIELLEVVLIMKNQKNLRSVAQKINLKEIKYMNGDNWYSKGCEIQLEEKENYDNSKRFKNWQFSEIQREPAFCQFEI